MIPIKMMTQPDETTCGPTCLHAIYNYYNDPITLPEVVSQVSYLEGGGTLAVMLAIHALKRGYKAKLYTYNLKVFDPTWFNNHSSKNSEIVQKLKEQKKYKSGLRLHRATDAYLEYLSLGGELLFEDLKASLLMKYFRKNIPILTGLSATYLYENAREYTTSSKEIIYHDVKGYPMGHFVVLCGNDLLRRKIIVADPYVMNTISGDNYYSVDIGRLINSIMLGIVTYDSNFLIITPGKGNPC